MLNSYSFTVQKPEFLVACALKLFQMFLLCNIVSRFFFRCMSPPSSVKRSVCVNLDTGILFHGFNLNVSCCSWKHMINGTDLFVAKTDDILHLVKIR